MTYKAIISDIDGTLAPLTLHSQVRDKVRSAIIELHKRNFIFGLATGKPFALIEHLVDELRLVSPVIVDNGSAIFDPVNRSPLWQSVMDVHAVRRIYEIAKIYNERMRFSSGRESFEVENGIPDTITPTKFMVTNLTYEKADEFIDTVTREFSNLTAIKASAYKGHQFVDVYVTNAEATKQHAVYKFAELVGIETDEIIAIGDHYNDFPLLMACGLKVAMGNAVNDLKAIADYIAPSVDEDGVADVINKFVLSV